MSTACYPTQSLLDVAKSVAAMRDNAHTAERLARAAKLLAEVRENIGLPAAHADELLQGIQPEDVVLRDSGASSPVSVRGLYLFFPSDRTHDLTPVLVNRESRAEIRITEPAEDLYAFIYAASIA